MSIEYVPICYCDYQLCSQTAAGIVYHSKGEGIRKTQCESNRQQNQEKLLDSYIQCICMHS